MLAILNKELKAYFSSAIGYIFMGTFLFISGLFFATSTILQMSTYYNAVFGSISFVFLIIIPILTMRIISEETRNKTDQLLYTAPVSMKQVVLGKFLAALVLFLITVGITILYPLILSLFGKLAVAEIISGYVGLILLGAAYISVGMFISSLTENQIVAAVGTFAALLFMYLVDFIKTSLPSGRTSGIVFFLSIIIIIALIMYYATKNIYTCVGTAIVGIIITVAIYLLKASFFEGFIQKVLGWFSLLTRYNAFSMGILSLSSIIYFISFSGIFLFLTVVMLEKKRWS